VLNLQKKHEKFLFDYINNEGRLIKRAFMWKLQGKRNIDIATKLQVAN
tara:strand:+ start:1324 stop:1467 length:144 start_codon:yes stop_codon:yes gene_type:complete